MTRERPAPKDRPNLLKTLNNTSIPTPVNGSGLYAKLAYIYLDKEWEPIPLAPGKKGPPPVDGTGHHGIVTRDKVHQWVAEYGDWDLAIRMPKGVVGIDVDAYKGGEPLGSLEEEWCDLPLTWMSSSRADGSGILYFRLSADAGVLVNGLPGGIHGDLIQRHHRYAKVAGAHPDTSDPYRWIDPQGNDTEDPLATSDLPLLPAAWIKALLAAERTVPKDGAPCELAPFDPITASADHGDYVAGILANATCDLAASKGSRHDSTIENVTALTRAGSRGQSGAVDALNQLGERWVTAMSADRGGQRNARYEFEAMVESAARLVASTPDPPEASQQLIEAIEAQSHRNLTDSAEPAPPSTWAPMDLSSVVSGGTTRPIATMLKRSDKAYLIYPGKLHWVQGEPESGKSWVTLIAAVQALADGLKVAYIDHEDDEHTFVERMRALGVDPDTICDQSRVRYINPHQAATTGARELAELDAWGPDLVIIDVATESIGLEGLELERNGQVEQWLSIYIRPLLEYGAAVIVIDHVTKSSEGRGRYALGAQHKLAAVSGAAYTVEVLEPIRRALDVEVQGRLRLTVAKDRPGTVRGSIPEGKGAAAIITITSYPDEGITFHVDLEQAVKDNKTRMLILEQLVMYEGSPTTELRKLANSNSVDAAKKALITEGYIIVNKVGQTHQHHLTDSGRALLQGSE